MRGVRLGGWRKIATATWGHPNDPQIYGDLEIDATKALAFVSEARSADVPLSVTHLVGKAIALALSENPDLNARLYRGRMIRRETVDVFFIVSADDGNELSGVKVERADEKPVVEIARELASRAGRIRSGTDEEYGKTKSVLAATPNLLLRTSLRFAAWLTADRDRSVPRLGLRRQTFGSAMVSSVGMFGIQHAYAPLSPYYRIPFLVLVGEVVKRPVVVDDAVEVRPILGLSATMDHRYVDGFHAARLARTVRRYLAAPAEHEHRL